MGSNEAMMRVAYTPEVFKVNSGWIVRVFRNGLHHGNVSNGITLSVFGEEPAIFSDELYDCKASDRRIGCQGDVVTGLAYIKGDPCCL